MTTLRQFIVGREHLAPGLFNWARFLWHVEIRKALAYPQMLRELFALIDAPHAVAVDVGANVGIVTRFFSLNFAKVHAVEPMPHLAARLAEIGMPRVTVHGCALGAESGELLMRTPLDQHGRRMDALTTASVDNRFALFGSQGVVETRVPQHTLDELLAGESPVRFVKIDVEGFEDAVLAGATRLLREQQPLLLIELGRVHNPRCRDTIAALNGLGFSGFAIDNDGLRRDVEGAIAAQPDNLVGVPASGWYGQWDFLFVPEARLPQVARFIAD